jgi:hypothetical protein
MKTAGLKATLLLCLYETTGPELAQKSVIDVRSRRANANGASESMLLSKDLSGWNFA